MFINTSSRFTKFYTANKAAIDTLLLIAQLIGYAIALIVLVAFIGWVSAIERAIAGIPNGIAWLNNLVESSMVTPQVLLLTPGKDAPTEPQPLIPPVSPDAAEPKPRAKRQTRATAKPVKEPRQRSKRQPKTKAGDYADSIAPTCTTIDRPCTV
jgi:hypothetical protein